MSALVLGLQGFSVRLGGRRVLVDIDLEVYGSQCLVVLGPGGAGKSTLLRTICGLNDGHPQIEVGGRVEYRGADGRDQSTGPRMVVQSPRRMTRCVFEFLASQCPTRSQYTRREFRRRLDERLTTLGFESMAPLFDADLLELASIDRRLVMIAAQCLHDPQLLCVDEPTAGLSHDQARRVVQCLETQREKRALLVVTHNQRHARQLGTDIALLAGGKIRECRDVESFFSAPQTEMAREFIRSGSCTVASPDSRPEELAPYSGGTH